MAEGVLVFGEASGEGAIDSTTAELLGAGRRLVEGVRGDVACALLGAGTEGLAQDAIAFGADRVLIVDDPFLADYQGDAFVPVAERICRELDPAIVLMGLSMMGRDMAPRLAARLGTAVAMDCDDLTMNGDKLLATRPCYGGNAHAQYSFTGTPQMATVRAKAMEASEMDSTRQGEITKMAAEVSSDSIRTKILDRRKEEEEGVRLEDAEAVVAGGRGLGGPEGFQPLEELAGILDGAVGATRAVCDLGWYPVNTQIGLTGKVVTPDLYIAVAISGASQHMSGISQVKNIVSINSDAEANIFNSSRFGIVGDWKEILPPFTAKVKELKGQ